MAETRRHETRTIKFIHIPWCICLYYIHESYVSRLYFEPIWLKIRIFLQLLVKFFNAGLKSLSKNSRTDQSKSLYQFIKICSNLPPPSSRFPSCFTTTPFSCGPHAIPFCIIVSHHVSSSPLLSSVLATS